MTKIEKIIQMIEERANRKQEPTEDFVSYNAKIKEAKSILKSINMLPPE